MKKVLVIIPAYNEAENIEKVVDDLIDNYPQFNYVVINDGSRDLTGSICREKGYNYIDLPVNLGLSGAFQAGMKYAYYSGYDYALQFDGDGQHNPEYISQMCHYAEKNNLDITIGSRFLEKRKTVNMRMIGNSILEACILLTTGKRIKDPTSGMRMYNREIIKKFAMLYNFGPEPDTMAFLIRCGARVGEIQVHMNEREAGESYLSISGSIVYMFQMITSIMIVQWFRKKV